jgi:uncharacterized phage protein (TIGR02218 family)
MVLLATRESSISDSQPVELYEFFHGWQGDPDDFVVAPTPAPVGVVVFSEPWTYGSTGSVYSPHDTAPWPAFNPNNLIGGIPANGTSGVFIMDELRYIGALGTGNGQAYHKHELTGLDVDCIYTLATSLTKSRNTGFMHTGVWVSARPGGHWYGGSGEVIINFKPREDGTATIFIGVKNMEWGAFVSEHLTLTFGPITVYQNCPGDPGYDQTMPSPFGRLFNFTSADVPITFRNTVYEPAVFLREGIKIGERTQEGQGLVLQIPRDHVIADLFREYRVSTAPVSVTVHRVHRPEAATGAADNDFLTLIRAQIAEVQTRGANMILQLKTASQLVQRKTPRTLDGIKCPWMLGDARTCKVDLEALRFDSTIAAVGNTTLTINSLQDHPALVDDPSYFDGGVVILSTGQRGSIRFRNGDDITMLVGLEDAAVGMDVTVLPGCDHTVETCLNRYDNVVNHGGEPDMPIRNFFTAGLAGNA